jgi:cyclophilin family peptidyl-prolyl cis-trans isomerase
MSGKQWFVVFAVLCAASVARFANAEEKKGAEPKPAGDQPKAAFAVKFTEYKKAIQDIEKLQAEFQTADAAKREKLNADLSAQVTHAQSLVNAMVEAAEAAYRTAPNADPEITNLLITVARYYTIGRQIGPGVPSKRNPEDIYYPIDGGDQYERALPIIELLIDNKAAEKEKELYVYGFLCAFMTNDYDLAKTYLAQVKETNALQTIADVANRGDKVEQQAGLMKNVMHLVSVCFGKLDEYKDLWTKESAIRAAEAKANDLPRVKLTTTKGVITVELFENEAPQTVANFLRLVKQGFYDGSPFHRVLPEFMAQGGAKTEDGAGGPGYTIRCECYRPDYRRHFRGTLSMAHAGRDTGNSQFFLTFVPTPHLNGMHTAFGRVIDGIEVLGDLQRRSPEHQMDAPKADKIIKAEVIRDRGHEYKFEKLTDR